jgi:hypothetical protein
LAAPRDACFLGAAFTRSPQSGQPIESRECAQIIAARHFGQSIPAGGRQQAHSQPLAQNKTG